MKTTLLFDFNHLCIRSLFAGHGVDWKDGDFSFHKHLVLNVILANLRQFNPSECILAVDDRKNWRKKLYPEYKANRQKERDASDFDWSAYFTYINTFVEELKELPFKVIQVPFSEADDIIAILTRYIINTENIIITSDSDYIQLLHNKHNRIYDPIKKKWMSSEDPLKELKVKIITGDKGDNIPGIKTRVGEKTAIKLIDTDSLDGFLTENNLHEKYALNEKLISFSNIPQVIENKIVETYNNYDFPKGPIDYFMFFVKHKLREHFDNATQNTLLLKKLEVGGDKNPLDEVF